MLRQDVQLIKMVNTFLPYADFQKTAKCLDYRRLGKQRCEARQILQTIQNPSSKGWQNHPAVNMWRGYEDALKLYFNVIVQEWIDRGYRNNLPLFEVDESKVKMPWWMSKDDFHFSHQASLCRKKPEYYTDKFPNLPKKYTTQGYIWPRIVENEQCLVFSDISTPKPFVAPRIPKRFRAVKKD